MSVNSKMTALADEIRELSGTTTPKGIDAMTSDVSAANTEINEQMDLIAQISSALENKAAGGVDLPSLSNPAVASDILSGKEAIDGDGNKMTGTISTKTSSNLTASGATVTVPAGYYASQATKTISSGSAKTPATTITKNPSISVSSSGLITASVSGTQNVTPTVTAGYVSSGTAGTITVSGSATKQLTTQAAKTVTPSTSSQTAVASGVYTTGAVTVAAIPSNYEDVTAETNAYTTKLTSLETAISALETELEGKASGGGSGGASVETYTGQIINSRMPELLGTLRYLDEDLSLQTISLSDAPYNFRPVKNSMFSIYTSQMYEGCSGAIRVATDSGERVFIASEDGFTITYSL